MCSAPWQRHVSFGLESFQARDPGMRLRSRVADTLGRLVQLLLVSLLPLPDLCGGGTESSCSSFVLGMLDSEGV